MYISIVCVYLYIYIYISLSLSLSLFLYLSIHIYIYLHIHIIHIYIYIYIIIIYIYICICTGRRALAGAAAPRQRRGRRRRLGEAPGARGLRRAGAVGRGPEEGALRLLLRGRPRHCRGAGARPGVPVGLRLPARAPGGGAAHARPLQVHGGHAADDGEAAAGPRATWRPQDIYIYIYIYIYTNDII